MLFRATLFTAFGSSQRYLSKNSDGTPRKLTAKDFYLAGGMTGFAAAFTEGPIDFYKSQVQVQIIRSKTVPNYVPPYKNMLDVVRQSIKVNGFRGPFQGLAPTILRNVPGNSAYLGSFQLMKEHMATKLDCKTNELPSYVILSAAGIGGLMYWCLTYPIDVIKSAQMSDSLVKSERQYGPVIETAKVCFPSFRFAYNCSAETL